MTSWYLLSAITTSLLLSLALRSLAHRLSRDAFAAGWARLLAAARIALMLACMGFGLAFAMRLVTPLALPAQAFLWVLGGILVLPWLANGIAGLWFLSRAHDGGLGDRVVACGHSGRIRDFGVTRLELESDGDDRVFLSYLSLARSPISVQKMGRSVGSTLVIERSEWSEDDLRFLRQTAVLAPYRDVTAPVSVEASGSRATVSMALVRSEAEAATKRLLLDALERRQAKAHRAPSAGLAR